MLTPNRVAKLTDFGKAVRGSDVGGLTNCRASSHRLAAIGSWEGDARTRRYGRDIKVKPLAS